MSNAQLGTFDELMDGVDDAVAMIAQRLRAIIFELHPAATEVVRLKDRAATYGLGPRKMIEGLCFLLVVGYFSGMIGGWLARRPHSAQFLQRLAGGILIALGIRLALTERQ